MDIFTKEMGAKDAFPVVFGHGWARDHRDFLPIAELIAPQARVILLDFPGFGGTPHPDSAWSTEDYARAVRAHLSDAFGVGRYIWVGHSFGARVGLRLASMADSPLTHLVVIAGAGVKRPRPPIVQMRSKLRSWAFRTKKAHAKTENEIIALEKEYGSPDYVQSRELGLRDIFLKTVQEDQSDELAKIKCAATLIYGGMDTETPPVLGKIMHRLIARSTYIECPEFDHNSILSRGRHQVAVMLLELLARGVE